MSARANLELKARYTDLTEARRRSLELGAEPAAVEEQVDTYYRVPTGRLKLRCVSGSPALLIAYHRPDQLATRRSSYTLVPVAEPGLLHEALTVTLGLLGEVRKRREILLWHNIRIHLDEVSSLGNFVEFEAVLAAAEPEELSHRRLAVLVETLGIAATDTVAAGYAHLLGFEP
ncbi:MAG: class IV adenylate cyclase [Armatimonadetes bacterium]|nr:class IV adenylate cyclase [Armatimonadota bacterium]